MERQLFTTLTLLFVSISTLCVAQEQFKANLINEAGYRTISFESSAGKFRIYFPDDMAAGDRISGTLETEPAGEGRVRTRNSKILSSYTVQAMGVRLSEKFKIEISESNRKFLVQILSSSGETLGETQIYILEKPMKGKQPGIRTNLSVTLTGDQIPVFSNSVFPSNATFYAQDGMGKKNDLAVLTASPRTVVLQSPGDLRSGPITIGQNNSENKTEIFLADLQLVVPDTRLSSGEQTYAEVAVPFDVKLHKVSAMKISSFNVTLENLNPSIVNMEGGNLHWVSFPVRNNLADKMGWELRRTITGVKPGSFSVSATLHQDLAISNDPFMPQLTELKTPEDFNDWAELLKKDLSYYVELQKTGEDALLANIQRARTQMPRANNMHPLADFKSIASALLRPLHVPKGATITWLSSYVSAKSIYKNSFNASGAVLSPAQKQLLYNASAIAAGIAKQLRDPLLQSTSDEVKSILSRLEHAQGSMADLKLSLSEMIRQTDLKLKNESESIYKYEMKDMMAASRLMEQEGIYYYLPPSGILFSMKQNPGSYGFHEDDPCENKGPITWTWHQTFPCKIELKIVDYGNTPGQQEVVDYIIEQLTKLSEKGGDIGSKMGKAFSFKGRAFSMFARCYRDWENWDITYICVAGRWKLQSMVPGNPPKGRDDLSGWIPLLNAGGNNEWFKTDDSKWVDDAIAKAVHCCP